MKVQKPTKQNSTAPVLTGADSSASRDVNPPTSTEQPPAATQADVVGASSEASASSSPPLEPPLRRVLSPVKLHGKRWEIDDEVSIEGLSDPQIQALVEGGILAPSLPRT